MSDLKTYPKTERLDDWISRAFEATEIPFSPVPGDWVRAKRDDESLGVIVSITDDEIVILWSNEPKGFDIFETGYVFAPYVPLQVTETIFTPSALRREKES